MTPSEGRQAEAEAEVESLAERIIDVINSADPTDRQSLREYAADLLKGGTEAIETERPERRPGAKGTNPIGMAILLGAISIPLLGIFPPVGLSVAAVAIVLGVVGLGLTIFRR